MVSVIRSPLWAISRHGRRSDKVIFEQAQAGKQPACVLLPVKARTSPTYSNLAAGTAISNSLGVSRRTLARRLTSEGLTFTKVLEELRSDLAKQYLKEGDLPISTIAWLLGYQEIGAFTRAYKRWTGKTPKQMRGTRVAR
jgi:AraC-like DNA-binding protein